MTNKFIATSSFVNNFNTYMLNNIFDFFTLQDVWILAMFYLQTMDKTYRDFVLLTILTRKDVTREEAELQIIFFYMRPQSMPFRGFRDSAFFNQIFGHIKDRANPSNKQLYSRYLHAMIRFYVRWKEEPFPLTQQGFFVLQDTEYYLEIYSKGSVLSQRRKTAIYVQPFREKIRYHIYEANCWNCYVIDSRELNLGKIFTKKQISQLYKIMDDDFKRHIWREICSKEYHKCLMIFQMPSLSFLAGTTSIIVPKGGDPLMLYPINFKKIIMQQRLDVLVTLIKAGVVFSEEYYDDLTQSGSLLMQDEVDKRERYAEHCRKFYRDFFSRSILSIMYLGMSIALPLFLILSFFIESFERHQDIFICVGAVFSMPIGLCGCYSFLFNCVYDENIQNVSHVADGWRCLAWAVIYCRKVFYFILSPPLEIYLFCLDLRPLSTPAFLLRVIQLLRENGGHPSEIHKLDAREKNWDAQLLAELEKEYVVPQTLPQQEESAQPQSLWQQCRFFLMGSKTRNDLRTPLIDSSPV